MSITGSLVSSGDPESSNAKGFEKRFTIFPAAACVVIGQGRDQSGYLLLHRGDPLTRHWKRSARESKAS